MLTTIIFHPCYFSYAAILLSFPTDLRESEPARAFLTFFYVFLLTWLWALFFFTKNFFEKSKFLQAVKAKSSAFNLMYKFSWKTLLINKIHVKGFECCREQVQLHIKGLSTTLIPQAALVKQ